MKKKVFFMTIAALTVASLTVGCSSDDNGGDGRDDVQAELHETPGRIELTESQQQMVTRGNDFAFGLMRGIDAAADGSYVVSPLSVGYLLGMLNDGAQGATRETIARVLGFGGYGAEAVKAFYGNLMVNSATLDELVTVETANVLYGNTSRRVNFSDAYSSDMKKFYQAGIESLDFTRVDESLLRINGWCNEKTHGMISEILSRDEFSSAAMAYLLNSVYFKGQWANGFNEEHTAKAPFTAADGTKTEVQMMAKHVTTGYMEDQRVKAVSLPYGSGAYHMVVMMPADGSKSTADDLMQSLNTTRWQQLTAAMTDVEADVYLPRFDTSTEVDLRKVLTDMGLSVIFSDQADFGRMLSSDESIALGMMKQKARIDVGEQGTEASAVTIGGVFTSALPEAMTYEFRADRPFVYVIAEKTTGAIFFVGKYTGR